VEPGTVFKHRALNPELEVQPGINVCDDYRDRVRRRSRHTLAAEGDTASAFFPGLPKKTPFPAQKARNGDDFTGRHGAGRRTASRRNAGRQISDDRVGEIA
jgi:hypothetical protein